MHRCLRSIHFPSLKVLATLAVLACGLIHASFAQESADETASSEDSVSTETTPATPAETADTEVPEEAKEPAPTPTPTPTPTPPSEIEVRLGKSNAAYASILPERPYKAISSFFATLVKGNIDAAYEIFVQGSPIAKKPEDILTLKEKTRQAIELFGALRGFEIVDYDQLGTSLIRVTCISLGDFYPLRWHLYFYRVTGDWTLVDIRVDDKLSSLFEDDVTPKPTAPATNP